MRARTLGTLVFASVFLLLAARSGAQQSGEQPTVSTMSPTGLKVDEHSSATTLSNTNKVFEEGENVLLEPAWMNNSASTVNNLFGTVTSFTGPPGATYGVFSPPPSGADYGSPAAAATTNCYDATAGHTCYEISVLQSGSRPVQHWDATFGETLSTGDSKTWTIHIGESFTDVPNTTGQYRFVETMFHKGITGGCGGTLFCPASPVTRAQIAVFLLVAEHNTGYVPPACTTPAFTDVPCSSGFAPWVNQLVSEGITAGCGGGLYCPGTAVTRGQIAVFLLKAQGGSAYVPPACTVPIFTDVPCSSGLAIWVNELANRGIAAGCGGGNFCPNNSVTRGQSAVFLTTTFTLTLYGP